MTFAALAVLYVSICAGVALRGRDANAALAALLATGMICVQLAFLFTR
jgi:hypothetical protein